jgi:hypothetical protein
MKETADVALEPLPFGYSDFAREQRGHPLPDRIADFWRQQLDGLDAPDYLEEDGPDPGGDIAGERVVVFSDDMTEALRGLCRDRRVTPFMAAVALVNTVLAVRSGSRDVAVSTTTTTRPGKWSSVQGNFSNVLLLRTTLPADPTFSQVLDLSRAGVFAALRHQPMPYLQLQDVLGRPLPETPVRVHYLPHQAHHYRLLDSKPSGDAWIEDAVFAGHPMEIGFAEDKRGRFAIWLSYDPARYTHRNAGELLDSCCQALRVACADPALTVSQLAGRIPALA